jgi:hypothetical protein
MNAQAPRKTWYGWLPWLAAYLAFMASLAAALVYARGRVISQLSSPEALADWQAWKAETERQAQRPGAPPRRPVHSAEPPLLILMRDHFPAIAAMTLVIGSFLFGFVMFVLRGIARGSQ